MSVQVTHERSSYSLRRRLVLAFSILMLIFLSLAGVVLERAFIQSVDAAFLERLQLQIFALIAIAEPSQGAYFTPEQTEPRYGQLDSGLYAIILDQGGNELWRSPSALNLDLEGQSVTLSKEVGVLRTGKVTTKSLGIMVWASYRTYWDQYSQAFSFIILESTAPAAAQVREFRKTLGIWFGLLILLLSAVQYFLLRWGTSPLQHLAAEVAQIEKGQQDLLEKTYPTELLPVSTNLNLMLRRERERQTRYQSTLADLAHSLKTPLALLNGSLDEAQSKSELPASMSGMKEQLQRMNDIISYQLRRAAGSHLGNALVSKAVSLESVFSRLLPALEKVYGYKAIQLTMALPAGLKFRGEENDLMELLGNILDNAFKYTHTKVNIGGEDTGAKLVLWIDDDGPGIPSTSREFVLQRGARLDTVQSGQGIGLAVSADIVKSYEGELRLTNSRLGGTRVEIIFSK
jgi:two-component system sensor histidine kinase PhoQ